MNLSEVIFMLPEKVPGMEGYDNVIRADKEVQDVDLCRKIIRAAGCDCKSWKKAERNGEG